MTVLLRERTVPEEGRSVTVNTLTSRPQTGACSRNTGMFFKGGGGHVGL